MIANNLIETTCTDCGRDDVLIEVQGAERQGHLARLCPVCIESRVEREHSVVDLKPASGLGAWEMIFALEYPIEERDLRYKALGDAEVDFARRGGEKIRDAVQTLVKTGVIKGFTIVHQPRRTAGW